MITTKALESVQFLAQQLSKRGLGLEAVSDSPVEVLANATVVVKDEDGSTEVLDTHATAEVTTVTTGPLPSTHNMEFDDLVERGIETVTTIVNVARNVVAPAQEELVTEVGKALADVTNNKLREYEVVVETLNTVLREGSFLTFLEEFKAAKMAPTNRILKFGETDITKITELMHTGFTSIDAAIDLFIATKGESWFLKVWSDFFNNDLNSDNRGFVEKVTEDKDVAMTVFLLSRGLFDKAPEETGLALSEYQDVISSYRNQAGYTLYHQLVQLDNLLKGNILVTAIRDKKVFVLEDTYNHWLENGGDVDILFGLMVAKGSDVHVAAIDANKDKYLKAWNEHVSYLNAITAENKYRTLREVLLKTFLVQLEREVDTQSGLENNVQQIYEKFKNQLRVTGDEVLRDINPAVLKLLCDTRFTNEGPYFILTRIDFHMKENPNLNAREAASIAIIEYVTDWVLKQVKVVEQ